jgi:hypothetical protein
MYGISGTNSDPAILITGLRDTGYDVNTALADVIDNSVDAGASIVEINIALRQMDNHW